MTDLERSIVAYAEFLDEVSLDRSGGGVESAEIHELTLVGSDAAPAIDDVRKRRRRWSCTIAATAAAVIAVAVLMTLMNESDPPTVVTDPHPADTRGEEPEPSASVGESLGDPATWSWTEVTDSLPGGQDDVEILSDGRRVYALRRHGPEYMWSSADGMAWNEVTGLPDEGLVDTTAAFSGGLLVGSTRPEAPPVMTLIEAGRVQQTSELPVDPDVLKTGRPVDSGVLDRYGTIEVVSAALGPRGGLVQVAPVLDELAIGRAAFGVAQLDGDVWPFIEQDVLIDDAVVYLETAGENPGIRVAGPVALADLGIDAATISEASGLFVTRDFTVWEPVPMPVPPESSITVASLSDPGHLLLVGVDDGFIALSKTDGTGTVWFSPDGKAWQELGLLRRDGEALVPWRGQALAFDGASMWQVTSAGITETPLLAGIPEGVGHGFGAGAGDAGLAYLDDGDEIVYSHDGTDWKRASLPDAIVAESDTCEGWCWSPPGLWVTTDAILVQPESDAERSLWLATPGD